MAVNFSFGTDLPHEIIDLFLKRVNCAEDLIKSGGVCKSWQSVVAAMLNNHQHQVRFSPWLMLSPPDDDDDSSHEQKVICLSTKKLYKFHLPPDRSTQGKRCWGSPFGWLLTIGLDLNIHLFNPLTQYQLSLPSQPTFLHQYQLSLPSQPTFHHQFQSLGPQHLRRVFVQKMVLSSNPSLFSSSVVVVAIYGSIGYLAFARPGDEAWTPIHCDRNNYRDAIFFNGQIYAVSNGGYLMVCENINSPFPHTIEVASPPPGAENTEKFYLVEMSGDLYMIERPYEVMNGDGPMRKLQYCSVDFLVYKLDFSTKTWNMLEDFGDYAMFLGNNTSFAISTSDFPEFKRNHIYFTDDHVQLFINSFCDMGVYDYGEEDTVETDISMGEDVLTKFTRPLFFIPNF
ncbi:SWR1-complex protein 3 [Ranunculus cassubicifolius]